MQVNKPIGNVEKIHWHLLQEQEQRNQLLFQRLRQLQRQQHPQLQKTETAAPKAVAAVSARAAAAPAAAATTMAAFGGWGVPVIA